MDDSGQMMVWEVTIFAALVLLSLVFLYQLSPPSIVSNKYSNDLKIIGDDALSALYNDKSIPATYPAGYPSNKLVHYLISDAYGSILSDLHNMLPTNVMYNIYVSNETDRIFWCNSQGDNAVPLLKVPPITICHCVFALDKTFFTTGEFYSNSLQYFNDTKGAAYDVSLELWYI